MTTNPIPRIAAGCIMLAMVLTPGTRADEPCEKCGYEEHWVDTCPGDSDWVPTSKVTLPLGHFRHPIKLMR